MPRQACQASSPRLLGFASSAGSDAQALDPSALRPCLACLGPSGQARPGSGHRTSGTLDQVTGSSWVGSGQGRVGLQGQGRATRARVGVRAFIGSSGLCQARPGANISSGSGPSGRLPEQPEPSAVGRRQGLSRVRAGQGQGRAQGRVGSGSGQTGQRPVGQGRPSYRARLLVHFVSLRSRFIFCRRRIYLLIYLWGFVRPGSRGTNKLQSWRAASPEPARTASAGPVVSSPVSLACQLACRACHQGRGRVRLSSGRPCQPLLSGPSSVSGPDQPACHLPSSKFFFCIVICHHRHRRTRTVPSSTVVVVNRRSRLQQPPP